MININSIRKTLSVSGNPQENSFNVGHMLSIRILILLFTYITLFTFIFLLVFINFVLVCFHYFCPSTDEYLILFVSHFM